MFHQATQLTHVLNRRLKELAEREKALKEVVEAIAKEKIKAAATTEKKVAASEKARVSAEKKSSELEAKLGETELRLAEATSLNTAQAEELVDLKVGLEACENKWYNEGFADAENSVEPVRKLESSPLRRVGWLPCKLWGSPRTLLYETPTKSLSQALLLLHKTLSVPLTRKRLLA